MTSRTARLIESQLPKRFLYDLGLYLQTCAHIELMICALICELEGLEIQSEKWVLRHSSLRKMKPDQLFKSLTQSACDSDRLAVFEPGLIDQLVDWMRVYIRNRHIAVHGAFFVTPEKDLRVNYWHIDKSTTPPQRNIEATKITEELVGEHIDDADRILRTLLGALGAIGAIKGNF